MSKDTTPPAGMQQRAGPGHDPVQAQARYQAGLADMDRSDWASACARFEEAIALHPGFAQAHNNLGAVLQMLDRLAEAEQAYARASVLEPALTQPCLNLGRLLVQAGRNAEAAHWYRQGLAGSTTAADREMFSHRIDSLGGAGAAQAPGGYVRGTFDSFAGDFDRHLVGALGYRVPEAIVAAIRECRPAAASLSVVDLGCGTGLAGALLRPLARRLTGVDLAPRMLDQARARGCYDVLDEADIVAWLREAPARSADLVVAADVFIYIGDLKAAFSGVAALLAPQGLFAFSTEVCDGPDWLLQPSGRYAQAPAYVSRLAMGAGFRVVLQREQALRKPLTGRLYVLERT